MKKNKTHEELNRLIIEEGEHKTLVRLAEKDIKQNLIITAIETLMDTRDIWMFMEELAKLYEEIRKDGKGVEAARTNVGYMIYYYDREMIKRWLDALPDISHPFFGRRLEIPPDEAFRAGYEYARAANASRKSNKEAG